MVGFIYFYGAFINQIQSKVTVFTGKINFTLFNFIRKDIQGMQLPVIAVFNTLTW